MQAIPFSEARAHLAEALRGVEVAQEPLVISRRGQAAGVLMSWSQYRQLVGASSGFAARLAEWRQDFVGTEDEADPFEGVRQPDTGRPFSW
ncbi:type II toxin-antitoxin system Phd/YefM family antitoxin [Cupriavidus pinatubonensis]|uniref:type II toxin-antitoxin system Phd/YefM family antitoxin n=1 Tax=Cupriavidus pinatubonensis TaxID=248026 RepID=UPI001CC81D78|nr:type II toxin-antitoxin system Phd/YefM family antitoxin [Cupriavidus pinatubonensis]